MRKIDVLSEALKVHNEACRAHKAALVKYRALDIDDEEFLAAKAVMVEADKVFDAAFVSAAGWGQEHKFCGKCGFAHA